MPYKSLIDPSSYRITPSRGNKTRFDVWWHKDRIGQYQNKYEANKKRADMILIANHFDYFLRGMA